MEAAGVDSKVAEDVGIYTRYNCFTWFLLLFEAHLEIAMVNLGYVKTCALNSLVTGCGVDIAGSYFFIYKHDLGVRGAAYTQWCVKTARLLFWAVAMFASGEWRVILRRGALTTKASSGTCTTSDTSSKSQIYVPPDGNTCMGGSDCEDLPSSPPALLKALSSPGAKCRESILPSASPRDFDYMYSRDLAKKEKGEELFSWAEWKLFVRTNVPTLVTVFCGWLVFELQVRLLPANCMYN